MVGLGDALFGDCEDRRGSLDLHGEPLVQA